MHTRLPRITVVLLTALSAAAWAAARQPEAADADREPPAIAAQFPDPPVEHATPGLTPGRRDFASHDEAVAFARDLARRVPRHVTVDTIGQSQQHRDIVALTLTGRGTIDASRPTLLVLGQQHGNEPAGGEGALALAADLAGPHASLLDRVNVLIIPRTNPDGADGFIRTTANGVDLNRDHLLLQTPEARAIANLTRRHRPQVVLDLHEFTVGDRWVRKFGVVQRYDALIQTATVGNQDPNLARLAEGDFVASVEEALRRAGQRLFTYHTTSQDPADRVVSMGGVQPDTGRNVAGLRHAVSLLIETRGVGIGRAHFARRVHAHVMAARAAIERAASLGPRLTAAVQQAERRSTAAACRGELVIDATHRPARRTLEFLDATSGEVRRLTVDWRAAAPLNVLRTRRRPCGYLLPATAITAVERLRALGVEVGKADSDNEWALEHYVVVSEGSGARLDARGAIDDGAPIRIVQVRTERAAEPIASDAIYVSLAQPLSGLIAAALEPDSQSSFVANRLLELDGLRRVHAVRRAR